MVVLASDRCTPIWPPMTARSPCQLLAAQAQLVDGIALDIKTLKLDRLSYAATSEQSAACAADRVTGKRVVVSLDGGRVRVGARSVAPSEEVQPIHTDWKPKLLILYVVATTGDRLSAPIIDGTLRGP